MKTCKQCDDREVHSKRAKLCSVCRDKNKTTAALRRREEVKSIRERGQRIRKEKGWI